MNNAAHIYGWLVVPFGYRRDGSINHIVGTYVAKDLNSAICTGIEFLHMAFNSYFRKEEKLDYSSVYSYPLVIKDGNTYSMDISKYFDKETEYTKFSVFIEPLYLHSSRYGTVVQCGYVDITIFRNKYCLIYKGKPYIINSIFNKVEGFPSIINDINGTVMCAFNKFLSILLSDNPPNINDECIKYCDISIIATSNNDLYCALHNNSALCISDNVKDVLNAIDEFCNRYFYLPYMGPYELPKNFGLAEIDMHRIDNILPYARFL